MEELSSTFQQKSIFYSCEIRRIEHIISVHCQTQVYVTAISESNSKAYFEFDFKDSRNRISKWLHTKVIPDTISYRIYRQSNTCVHRSIGMYKIPEEGSNTL